MVQCFTKRNTAPQIPLLMTPHLAYVSRTDEENSAHPRVMHAHSDLLEIVLVTSGKGRYSIGGSLHTICGGDLMIYNSGVIHDEPSGPEDRTRRYCCAIANLQIEGLPANALIAQTESPVCHLDEAALHRITQLMDLLFETLVAQDEGTCHYLMLSLLQACWAALHQKQLPEEDLSQNVLGQRIKEYIDQNYAQDVSLGSIAEQLGISPYYLAHVFKDMTGYSPRQYILRRRIGEAQTLLISTHDSVTQIASQVGYDTISHFNQLFSKHVGMSPREYRRNYILSDGKPKKIPPS